MQPNVKASSMCGNKASVGTISSMRRQRIDLRASQATGQSSFAIPRGVVSNPVGNVIPCDRFSPNMSLEFKALTFIGE